MAKVSHSHAGAALADCLISPRYNAFQCQRYNDVYNAALHFVRSCVTHGRLCTSVIAMVKSTVFKRNYAHTLLKPKRYNLLEESSDNAAAAKPTLHTPRIHHRETDRDRDAHASTETHMRRTRRTRARQPKRA